MAKLEDLPPELHQMIVRKLVFEYLNNTGTATFRDVTRLQDVSSYWSQMVVQAVDADRRKRKREQGNSRQYLPKAQYAQTYRAANWTDNYE